MMAWAYTAEERYDLAIARGIEVDPEDEWWLYEASWHLDAYGYAVGCVRGRMMKLHHAIMGQPIWADGEIDHINRRKLDNRRSNLRWSNRTEQNNNHPWETE